MKSKFLALIIVLILTLSISNIALAAKVVGEVDGLFIDPIDDITLNSGEFVDMQTNGLEIPVTGYVQYWTGDNNPRLTDLVVKNQLWDGTDWVDIDEVDVDDFPLIDWASTPLEDIPIRDGITGREFTDAAFSQKIWKIYDTGTYRVCAWSHFTGGAEPTYTEEFVIEVIDTIIVYPMAAPNITEIILEAEGINPQQSTGKGEDRTFINLIQFTAHHMGPQTLFDGVEKSIIDDDIEVCNPAYWDEVLNFLNDQIDLYDLDIGPLTYTLDDYIADLG